MRSAFSSISVARLASALATWAVVWLTVAR